MGLLKRRKGRIELFPDTPGGWRFRIIAGNGEIVAQSESYTRKESARKTAELLAQPGVPVVEVEE